MSGRLFQVAMTGCHRNTGLAGREALSEMASMKDGGGNYKISIVDLLRLLDLDSSRTARKALADQLTVHSSEPCSTKGNIALNKDVMDKLAGNGGVVPDSLRQ